MWHARQSGSMRGERNGAAKLTPGQVAYIRRRYADGGITHRALAWEFGLCHQAVGDILTGRRWPHLGPVSSTPNRRAWPAKLTPDAVRDILRRYAGGGVTQAALAAEYGVTRSCIAGIVQGRKWTHLDVGG